MAKDHLPMSYSEMLLSLGFEKQDLGINSECVHSYFYFEGETHAFDEGGYSWTKKGKINLGEWYFFLTPPVLWGLPAGDPEIWETAA
jgi:hypothetical protein